MTAAKKKPPAVGDQPWRYTYVSTPVMWAVSIWGVAVAAYGMHLTLFVLTLTGAGLMVLAPIAAPARHRFFGFALGAAVAFYLWSYPGHDSPLSRDGILWLIPGGAVFGVWWHLLGRYLADVDAEQATRDAAKLAKMEAASIRQDLPQILANCGFKGIEGGPVETFDAGTTQRLTLPVTGSIEFKHLHAATPRIEIACRAKFPIRFVPGDHIAEVVAIILNRDVLAETLPYPVDRAPKSIHDPMPLGRDELGVVQFVTFRELSGMFVGERGSGKSGLINSHLAYLTGCTDALVWMIDGKGGRTARPWLQPFLDGIGKPAIDWVAITQAEADWVLLAARTLIEHRSRGAGEKVSPTAGQPAVIVIIEEASLMTGTGDTGNAARAEVTKQVVVLGRSEAVEGILVTQRGTVTMLGSGDMKSQLQYVVALGISKLEDAVRIFADSSMAREVLRYAGDLKYQGVMLVKSRGWRSVTPVKGWWLAPGDIYGVAQTNAIHRPEIEPAGVDFIEFVLAGTKCAGGYAGRWDRFAAEMAATSRETATASHGVSHPGVSPTSRETPPGVSHETGNGVSHETPETPAQRMVRDAKETARVRRDRDTFERLMRDAFPPGETPDETASETTGETPEETDGETPQVSHELVYNPDVIPPILGCLKAVFAGRGEELIPTTVLLEADVFAGLTPKRLGLLMGHCGVAPRENIPWGDQRLRGYARVDVEKAFCRARDTGAPKQAFDWRP